MKKRKFYKKVLAGLLTVTVLNSTGIPTIIVQAQNNKNITMSQTKSNEKTYIKIRYNREDKEYDGWNLWIKDSEGKERKLDFIGEDSEGKFAVVEASSADEKLGFSLRNKDEENYFKETKFISLTQGDREIIINHNDVVEARDFKDVELNRNFEEVQLNLHYYRFDNNYENWDIWSWLYGKEGQGYGFDGEDEFGKIATIKYDGKNNNKDPKDVEKIGFIIRKSDWSDREPFGDRFVDLAYANKDGVVDIYIVQGDSNIHYSPSEDIKKAKYRVCRNGYPKRNNI